VFPLHAIRVRANWELTNTISGSLKGDAVSSNRIAAYLRSRRNLVGCALGLVAAALTIFDPVGPAGLLLVPAFYLVGAAAMPPDRRISPYGFEPRQLEKALRDEITAVSGRVPPEVIARIQRIELLMRTEILPRIDRLPLGSKDLYVVEQTARDYLPTAVQNYLELPRGYVSAQPNNRPPSALAVLLDELDLLETQMRRVAGLIQRIDMDRMLAHHRFLSDRFNASDVSS
jgi:hypothetical protein